MSLPIVKVRHLRHAEGHFYRLFAPWEIRKLGGDFAPRGGTTEVTLLDPDTREVIATGKAVCNDKENYCKKVGRDIAVGRAFKAWEKSLAPDLKVIRWLGGGSIWKLQLADIAINAIDVVVKDRYGPSGRIATPKEIAMIRNVV